MSEYIIDFNDERFTVEPVEHNGEIVRCRDCAYRRNGWNGKRPTFSDWFFCAYWGGHELTNLDGYCAWGIKRKEGE